MKISKKLFTFKSKKSNSLHVSVFNHTNNTKLLFFEWFQISLKRSDSHNFVRDENFQGVKVIGMEKDWKFEVINESIPNFDIPF